MCRYNNLGAGAMAVVVGWWWWMHQKMNMSLREPDQATQLQIGHSLSKLNLKYRVNGSSNGRM